VESFSPSLGKRKSSEMEPFNEKGEITLSLTIAIYLQQFV
jgi:hypothetical protein